MVDRKAVSVAFLPKISAETLSVSAERNFPISVFLQKGLFLPKEGVSAERSFFLQKLEGYFAEINGHFCRKGSIFLQKQLLSAETASFCRKSPFRFFRYFCRNKIFWVALFLLSAEREKFSFGRPLLTLQIYKRKGHSLLRMKQYGASKEAFAKCLDMIGKSDMNSKLRDKTRITIKKQMTVFNVVKELREGWYIVWCVVCFSYWNSTCVNAWFWKGLLYYKIMRHFTILGTRTCKSPPSRWQVVPLRTSLRPGKCFRNLLSLENIMVIVIFPPTEVWSWQSFSFGGTSNWRILAKILLWISLKAPWLRSRITSWWRPRSYASRTSC